MKKLLNKIHQEFPQLQYKEAKINNTGWDHHIIILDDNIIFRFPKDKARQRLLKNEIKLLKFLKNKINLNIPDYKYIAKDFAFAGYHIINGHSFQPWVFKQKINAQNKIIIAQQLADFISTLHAIPKTQIEQYNVKHFSFRQIHKTYLTEYKKYLQPKLSVLEKKAVSKHFQQLQTINSKNYKPVLVHGDIWCENVIINNNYTKIAGIIDFSDRVLFDPAIDFAYLYSYGQKFLHQVYDLYTGRKDLDFLNRAFIYYQRDAVDTMIHSLKGYPVSFPKAYRLFRLRF